MTPVPPPIRPAFGVHSLHPDAPAGAVALTVDDGPHPRWTPKVLDLLAEYQVRATFFVIGKKVRQFPDLTQRITAAGHAIGNHTMHHPQPFAALDEERITREVVQAQRHIEDATRVAPRLFRAPAGEWSAQVLAAATEAGLIPVDWSVDPKDWSHPGTAHIARTLRRSNGGDILICHDGGRDATPTIDALAAVIPELKQRCLQFVAL
ncbi:MAG: polysaccharide deacetylase family protein [Streptosporangiales bacterium]|nr:polysaccharide deacetylase family protein [Streptosporangiales bacterium]